MHFFRILRQIPEKSDVCRFFTQICENKLENCRNFKFLKFVKIIQYYSILFNRLLSVDCIVAVASTGAGAEVPGPYLSPAMMASVPPAPVSEPVVPRRSGRRLLGEKEKRKKCTLKIKQTRTENY